MKARLSPEELYQALLDRDAAYDGVFVVAVRTTGIFCRPTCSAKKPRFENVTFFETVDQARRAGFRACKRCRPDAQTADPTWVCDLMALIASKPERVTDHDLRSLGIVPTRARRYFVERYGMTFHGFHRAKRLGHAMNEVRNGEDLLEVGLDHGFDSASGFRDAFGRLFGTSPGKARSADCLFAQRLETPLGAMLAVANDEGICLLEFVDRRSMEAQVTQLRKYFPQQVVPGTNENLERLVDELTRYFAGQLTTFSVPLSYPGSAFQRAVWDVLKTIPFGETTSYGAIAQKIGRPGASQAVGRANGDNRLAILLPCHRVVRSDGHLCGYAGGLRRKEWLLNLEKRVAGKSAWLFGQDPLIGEETEPLPMK